MPANPMNPTLVQEEQLRTWLVLSNMAFLSSTPIPFRNRAGSVSPSYFGPLSPLLTNHSYQADTPLYPHTLPESASITPNCAHAGLAMHKHLFLPKQSCSNAQGSRSCNHIRPTRGDIMHKLANMLPAPFDGKSAEDTLACMQHCRPGE